MKGDVVTPEMLHNGQCWEQREFPCFEIMVLMLDRVEGELMFCKVAIGSNGSPLVMVDEDGTWMWDALDLYKQLVERRYTPMGHGVVKVEGEE